MRFLIMLVGLAVTFPAAAQELTAKQYKEVQRNLRKKSGLIDSIISNCATQMHARGRISSEMAASVGADEKGAARIYCSRLFTAVAAERLSLKDFNSLERGRPTTNADKILRGG